MGFALEMPRMKDYFSLFPRPDPAEPPQSRRHTYKVLWSLTVKQFIEQPYNRHVTHKIHRISRLFQIYSHPVHHPQPHPVPQTLIKGIVHSPVQKSSKNPLKIANFSRELSSCTSNSKDNLGFSGHFIFQISNRHFYVLLIVLRIKLFVFTGKKIMKSCEFSLTPCRFIDVKRHFT